MKILPFARRRALPPPEPSPQPPADLTTLIVVAQARHVGWDLDLDELHIATALHNDLVLRIVAAAFALAAYRHSRDLTAHAIEDLRDISGDDGTHDTEIAELTAATASLDERIPQMQGLLAGACRALHATGLGAAWPIP